MLCKTEIWHILLLAPRKGKPVFLAVYQIIQPLIYLGCFLSSSFYPSNVSFYLRGTLVSNGWLTIILSRSHWRKEYSWQWKFNLAQTRRFPVYVILSWERRYTKHWYLFSAQTCSFSRPADDTKKNCQGLESQYQREQWARTWCSTNVQWCEKHIFNSQPSYGRLFTNNSTNRSPERYRP